MTPDLLGRLREALGAHLEIERELGGGGMSRVFIAEERALGRRVVVKVLPPELSSEVSAERFRREIQVAARLQHPHIVPLLSAGEAAGVLYYTMPYIEGESLRGRLSRDGALAIPEAVRLLREVFDALACAHAQAVVHRDIKPENILLSQGHALVTDFGVSKALAAATDLERVTGSGLALGTPSYMAPEQAAADPNTDHRADIYAAGVVGYEMLTGGPPFVGMPPQAILAAHATTLPENVRVRRQAVPRELALTVMRCLEKHPADRPQSAAEALAALDAVAVSGAREANVAGQPLWRGRKGVALAVAASMLLVAAVALVQKERRGLPGAEQGSGNSADGQSLAVMPFRNLSGESENEYFADGMTEELIGALTRVEGLRVAPRSSAFAFKNTNATPADVRDRLRVTSILEGSIQTSGRRLRVNVQLVDAASERNLWSETYDRQLADVFAVQDEIARSIVAALRMRLSPRAQQRIESRSTADVEAYGSYLKGRFYWNQRTDEGFQRAIAYFQDAVRRDPAFARAYSGMADAYTLSALNASGVPRENFPKAKLAALRAIALDSTLAEPHASLGLLLHVQDWNWRGAEAAFRRAIQLDSTYASAHHWYAMELTAMGRHGEAIAEARRAQQLDPLSLPINADLGQMLYCAGKFSEASEQLRRTIELDSTFARAHGLSGLVLLAKGDVRRAIPEIKTAIRLRGGRVSEAWGQPSLAYAWAISGQGDSARAIIAQVQGWSSPAAVARALPPMYAGLGDMNQAFDWLNRALDDRVMIPTWLRQPIYDGMRTDPRWKKILQRLGLEE